MQSTPALAHLSAPLTEGTTWSHLNPAFLILSPQGTGSPAEVNITLNWFLISGFSLTTFIAVSMRIVDRGTNSADTITLIPNIPPWSLVKRKVLFRTFSRTVD